ncbi:MAG: ABC transporter permease [Bdellovibrionales bacterium]|nr:ABC transporter permease [Bdellovibrionales bacterium]
MKTTVWLAWKLWWTRQTLFGGSAPLALLGLVLGVASLVASMAVMSGFESTLKEAMSDVTGHVTVMRRPRSLDPWQELEARLKALEPTLESTMRFTYVEAIAAKKGQVLGVMIQGVDPERVHSVLHFDNRLKEGQIDFSSGDGKSGALVGQGVARRLGLKVGDHFKVIVPLTKELDPSQFTRQMSEFVVKGILDLGKYDWNQRFILTDLKSSQALAQMPPERYTGLTLKFKDIDYARTAAFHLSQEMGSQYFIRDWRDVNENLFEAVKYERVVIFFVVLVIVIVSAFNVSSTLLVNVVRRYSDIAILKALGLSQKKILQIYSMQGLILGGCGLVAGILLGFFLCFLFSIYQTKLGLISGDVYKVEAIHVEIRMIDLFVVSLCTLVICFLATLAPARRGARLEPVEGLRYG